MERKRLHDIDKAKGLAIFLVVLGHITLKSFPENNDWYVTLHKLIYTFHMPFFMFLSGLVMNYTYKPVTSSTDYFNYVKKKFIRLIPAFILFGTLIGAGKLIFQHFMHVDNASDIIKGFIYLFTKPIESHASSLWYVYVLFAYFMIMPIILLAIRGNKIILLFIVLSVHFIHLPRNFALDRIGEYMFVFSLGMGAAEYWDHYLRIIDRYRLLFFLLFMVSLATMPIDTNYPLSKLVIGLSSIPALHSLIRTGFFSRRRILDTFGKYTFPIYLMNTIAIGFTKGIILKFMSWNGTNFLFIAPILLFSGIFVPIIIKKKVLSRVPMLDAITN